MIAKASGSSLRKQVDPGIGSCSAALSSSEHSRHPLLNQDPVDVVALLAARSRVHPASIMAQMVAWGLEVRQ